jgi:hypothetical protein
VETGAVFVKRIDQVIFLGVGDLEYFPAAFPPAANHEGQPTDGEWKKR